MQRHSTPMWAPPPCFIFDFYCVLCRNVPLENTGGWREGTVEGCRGAAADTLLGLNRRRSSLPFYVYSWRWWQVKICSETTSETKQWVFSVVMPNTMLLFFVFLQSNKFLRFFTGTTWFQLHYFLPNIVNGLRCVFTLFSRHFPYGRGIWKRVCGHRVASVRTICFNLCLHVLIF